VYTKFNLENGREEADFELSGGAAEGQGQSHIGKVSNFCARFEGFYIIVSEDLLFWDMTFCLWWVASDASKISSPFIFRGQAVHDECQTQGEWMG
jgi:hypothetical protein